MRFSRSISTHHIPRRFLQCVLVFLAFTIFCVTSPSQNSTGRLVGHITDPQGVAVPGAKVTATNAETNAHWETISDPSGSYQILDVPVGRYYLTVEREGFAKVVTQPEQLDINQSLRVDVSLKIGALTEEVRVTSEVELVETVNPTLGGTVTGAPVHDLPLNGRDVFDLALTQPGVVPRVTNVYTAGSFTVAGGRSDAVTFLLDGAVNNAIVDNNVNFNPNPDTIAEFRILQNNYTAEFGRNGGGIVSVVTKSGSNEFHGSAFEFLRNDAFNANTFFNKANFQHIISQPILKRNQFGGTLGGPVMKGRLFFFFGYQGQRQSATISGNDVSSFTTNELQGDFSQAGHGGTPDTEVAAFLESHPYYQPDPTLAAEAKIDPTRFDTLAKGFISNNLIPSSPNGVVHPRGNSTDQRDEYTAKVDFNVAERDRLSLTLGYNHNPRTYPFTSDGSVPNVVGFPGFNEADSYFGSATYTRTFSPTLLNEFHLGAQRFFRKLNFPERKLPTPNELGVQANSDDPIGPPIITISSGLGMGFNANGPAHYADNTYSFTDALSWSRNRHNWKFGGSLGIIQNNATYDYATSGEFDYYGTASGNPLADFLLGAPDDFQQYPRDGSLIRSKQYAGYAQDEWRATNRLTLIFGIRYEYSTPKTDPQGRLWSIIPGLQSTRFVNAPLGLVFPGDKGAPSGSNFPDKNDWAPRFGFAWDVFGNGSTSVRGGFGVYYDLLRGEDNNYVQGAPPFYSGAFLTFDPTAILANSANNYTTQPYVATGQIDPFPSTPPTSTVAFYNEFGTGWVTINPYLRTPYIYQYNLNVQQQLGKNTVAEVSYVGSSSHKLTALVDRNPIILGTDTRILNTQSGLTNSDAFGVMHYNIDNAANANYNALVASLTKRVSDWHSMGETFFTLGYTFARNIDNASGYLESSQSVPAYNSRAFRAPSDMDIKYRLVLSGGWELPFAHAWESGPKRLTQGWAMYPIFFVQSGFPLSVNAGLPGSFDAGLPGPSGAGDVWLVQADLNGSKVPILDPKSNSNHYYFDPSVLSAPNLVTEPSAPGFIPSASQRTYGTLPRNFFRGPGRVNVDLALKKETALTERLNLEFRVEAFNLLNHAEWLNPDTSSVQSGTLGQVSSTYDPRILQLALRLAF